MQSRKDQNRSYATGKKSLLSRLQIETMKIAQAIFGLPTNGKLNNQLMSIHYPLLINPAKPEAIHTTTINLWLQQGRLSLPNTNLQKISQSERARGREIRKAFVPRDENHILPCG